MDATPRVCDIIRYGLRKNVTRGPAVLHLQAGIEKAARAFVARHGHAAEEVARQVSLRLSWRGRPRAAMVWQRIGSAIRYLQRHGHLHPHGLRQGADQGRASGA